MRKNYLKFWDDISLNEIDPSSSRINRVLSIKMISTLDFFNDYRTTDSLLKLKLYYMQEV